MNSNIRCIEIHIRECGHAANHRWIVTLDVLKLMLLTLMITALVLNSNIRCIEIWINMVKLIYACSLNSNIRCIEIFNLLTDCTYILSWIVTLDVLKWAKTKAFTGGEIVE